MDEEAKAALESILSALLDQQTESISKGDYSVPWDIEGAEINDGPDGPELLIVHKGQMLAIRAELI